jgi:transcription antitermination factor NusG
MNTMVHKPLDVVSPGAVTVGHALSERKLPECGSHSGRWYCVETHQGREAEVRDRLDDQGFGAFLPLVMELRPWRPGIMRAAAVPAFPRYLLVRFDRRAQPWRSILYTRGVKGLLSAGPEAPLPVADRQVQALFALGYDRPIMQDPRPALIEAGAKLRVTGGAFADHEGVCLWDSGKRVRLLMSLLGGQREVTVPRKVVELA